MNEAVKYEALIDNVKTKSDKNGEAVATVTLILRSSVPESEFAPILGMMRAYCLVKFSPTKRKPISLDEDY